MTNLLQQAINCDDADRAAKITSRRARHREWRPDREHEPANAGEVLA